MFNNLPFFEKYKQSKVYIGEFRGKDFKFFLDVENKVIIILAFSYYSKGSIYICDIKNELPGIPLHSKEIGYFNTQHICYGNNRLFWCEKYDRYWFLYSYDLKSKNKKKLIKLEHEPRNIFCNKDYVFYVVGYSTGISGNITYDITYIVQIGINGGKKNTKNTKTIKFDYYADVVPDMDGLNFLVLSRAKGLEEFNANKFKITKRHKYKLTCKGTFPQKISFEPNPARIVITTCFPKGTCLLECWNSMFGVKKLELKADEVCFLEFIGYNALIIFRKDQKVFYRYYDKNFNIIGQESEIPSSYMGTKFLIAKFGLLFEVANKKTVDEHFYFTLKTRKLNLPLVPDSIPKKEIKGGCCGVM